MVRICHPIPDRCLLHADFRPAHKAYKAMSDHYAWWIMLPQDEFARIVDPSDQVFILLAANCMSTPTSASFLTIATGSP